MKKPLHRSPDLNLGSPTYGGTDYENMFNDRFIDSGMCCVRQEQRPVRSVCRDLKAETEFRAAILGKDLAALDRIWTDDYTFTNGRGMFLTKAERLENIKTGETEVTSAKFTDQNI